MIENAVKFLHSSAAYGLAANLVHTGQWFKPDRKEQKFLDFKFV